MQITDLSQIRNVYEHIYLSPHLDDAVLSCGGAIMQQRRRGERVLVVTLCTAAPPPEGPFSELAEEFHRHWALEPDQVVAARLREDAEANERVGADFYWAGMLDAIYRYPEAYHQRATLFGTPAENDPLFDDLRGFVAGLSDHAPQATLYVPLGIGNHVDHQITYQSALAASRQRIVFYEDFPYVAKPGALDRRMAQISERFRDNLVDLDDLLQKKIYAIGAYASQLVDLFGNQGELAMSQSVSDYAQSVGASGGGPAERQWQMVGAGG